MNEYAQCILNDIRSKLTGEYEKDMEYLHTCSEKYKDDEESQEILSGIADIMYQILPESEKINLSDKLAELNSNVESEYTEVKNLIQTGDLVKAKIKMEGILTSFDGIFQEDDNNIWLSFNHIIEMYIYNYYFTPIKEIRCADVLYSEYYRTYGMILMQMEEYEKAEETFKHSLKWNPVDLDTILAFCESLKFQGKKEKYLKTTKKSYRFCCTRATMARYYRNLGYYYLENNQPETARAVYIYSNIYFKTDNADSELKYIESALNTKLPDYTLEELQNILSENGIELGPDSVTIGIIFRVGQILKENGDRERAKDCFSIVYDITQDEETGELLNEL